MVDWGRGYGATTPSHLGLLGTGPLCTAFSSARHLQRCFTSSDMRDLLVKDGIGREMTGQIGLRFWLPRKSQGSFTCRKSATWDRRLYFPSEGRHAVDFFARKIQQLRPGLNWRSWVPEASMQSSWQYGRHVEQVSKKLNNLEIFETRWTHTRSDGDILMKLNKYVHSLNDKIRI
jgi:hypothetical protein